MSKANTPATSPPIPARLGEPTLSQGVLELLARDEPEAAKLLVTRAGRQRESTAVEYLAAKLVLENASIPGTAIERRYAEAARRAKQ